MLNVTVQRGHCGIVHILRHITALTLKMLESNAVYILSPTFCFNLFPCLFLSPSFAQFSIAPGKCVL